MQLVATQRLIDASAQLDPADRALLNLWLHRGLEDAVLARMTGLEPEAIAARRVSLVHHLSAELGLPPHEIAAAIAAIARPAEVPSPEVNGASRNGHSPDSSNNVDITDEVEVGEPEPGPAKDTESRESRRRRGRALTGAAGALALAVLLVVVPILSASGGSGRRRATPIPTGGTPAPLTPVVHFLPSPAKTTRRTDRLVALPGAAKSASGSVKLIRSGRKLRLRLTLSGLPVKRHGHYEAWVYNSVSEAKPLGIVKPRIRNLTVTLPRRAPHFRWIDVSFQPRGYVNPSGESVVRARNPIWAGR